MAGELEAAVRRVLDAFDRVDADESVKLVTDDAQGIDELSRRWMRGRDELADYLRGLEGAISDVHSEIRDLHERVWDDTGVATFWLEQDYTSDGRREHVSAPTTVVFRREGAEWKVAVFHSAPLPQ